MFSKFYDTPQIISGIICYETNKQTSEPVIQTGAYPHMPMAAGGYRNSGRWGRGVTAHSSAVQLAITVSMLRTDKQTYSKRHVPQHAYRHVGITKSGDSNTPTTSGRADE